MTEQGEYDSQIAARKKAIGDFIVKYLDKHGATEEKILILRVYSIFNELIPYSVLIRLKSDGIIKREKNKKWSIKQ